MKPVTKKLLDWYSGNKRNLPWRRTSDPYRIWLSEAMLQQTRVEQATPYYERFLRVFPDVYSLAEADEEHVLKLWEGLGYYSRARNLHQASRKIVQLGQFPATAAELRELPGIGPYMGNAIAAIAFGEDAIALDGNLLRVGSRLWAIKRRIDLPETKMDIEKKLYALLPRGKAGDFNQALMDLGATICTPKAPQCPECPLNTHCRARRTAHPESFPYKKAKPKRPHWNVAVAVIERGGKVLIAKRPNSGLLAGLWEFPGGKQEKGETIARACEREIQEEMGMRISVGKNIARIKHEYTHFKVTLHVFRCTTKGAPKTKQAWKWVTRKQLKRFPMPGSNHKFMRLV